MGLKRISKRGLIMMAVIWLALPLVLFMLFWVRMWIGLPLSVLVIIGVIKVCREVRNPDSCVMVVDWRFWLLAVLMLAFVVFAGIGGFFYQFFWDHAFRNRVFEELIDNPWPVVREDGANFQLLSYYLGFWLPAAALAKITGSMIVGDISLLIYAWVGGMLALMFVSRFVGVKKGSLVVFLFFVLYAGLDIVLMLIYVTDYTFSFEGLIYNCIDGPTTLFYDPTVSRQFFCIYNSGIPAWVALGLLWCQRYSFSTLCLAYSLIFIFAPIPALGILPVMAMWILTHIKKSFTLWNASGILVFTVVGLYYLANNNGGAIRADMDYDWPDRYWRMLLYVIFTYAVYFPFIWGLIKHNLLFWSLLATALVFTEFTLGGENDLAWKVFLPFGCYMSVMVLKAALRTPSWVWWKKSVFFCVLSVAFLGSFGFYLNQLREGYRYILSDRPFKSYLFEDLFNAEKNPCYGNFISEGESIFSRYIMRRADNERDDES